jgi:hypothetical protein
MEVADDVKEHSVKMKFSFAHPAVRFDLSCIAFSAILWVFGLILIFFIDGRLKGLAPESLRSGGIIYPRLPTLPPTMSSYKVSTNPWRRL